MKNTLKTTILLGALTGLILFFGGYFGGRQGMIMALGFAAIMNFASYWFSDKIILATYRAKPVTEAEAPELHSIVHELATRSGIPMPKVYVIPTPSPNAFATGRNKNHAAVAITEGLLNILDREEIKGVLAHELAHINHKDILISAIAATMAGAIMLLANMARWGAIFGGFGGSRDERGSNAFALLFMAILAPFAAMIIQLAISRSREYLADEGGAKLAGSPLGLASALGKLQQATNRIPILNHPSTSHLFIVAPFSGRSMLKLFSTHPPVEERIARLRKMAHVI